jgi:PilZ domain
MSNERRNEPRVRRNDELTIEWADASYDAHEIPGRCLDLSTTGMRLHLTKPIPAGQYVKFSVVDGGFRGFGMVRNIRPEGNGFVAGIRFVWQMKTKAA